MNILETCRQRLLKNDHHALVDLCEALSLEGDPRFPILSAQLELAMTEMIAANFEPNYVVSRWQCLCVFALRIMSPGGLKLAEAIDKATRRK